MKEYELNIDLALEIPEDVDPEAFYLQILEEINGLFEANNVKAAGPSSFVRIEADEWDYTKGPKPADVDHLITELEDEDQDQRLAQALELLEEALILVDEAEDERWETVKFEAKKNDPVGSGPIPFAELMKAYETSDKIRRFLGLEPKEF